jgi:hypothetical protein
MVEEYSDPQKRDSSGDKSHLPLFDALPEHTDANQVADASQEEQEEKESLTHMSKLYDAFFKNKAAAWTAIFTCVLAVFSWLLLEANIDANKTSTATQRAFVTYVTMYLEPVINGGVIPTGPHPSVTNYRLHLPMINSGTTPTKYSTYEMAVAVQDFAPSEGTDFDALQQAQRYPFVFGPKQTYDGLGDAISVSDIEALRDNKKHAFFWGWIVYRDIFERTPIHLSEFCFNVTNPRWSKPNHTDPTAQMLVTTLPCQTHNCYDEDCKDYSKRIEGFK